MSKNESQIMKGVAILLMIFLHLFNQMSNVDLCHTFLYFRGEPLVYVLTGATNPVAFFLILGGYGLYKVNERGDRHRWSRVLKLFIHYWIILAIFLTIGHFIYPAKYPGSIIKLIGNMTSFTPSYNGEMWFMFPYVALSLAAPWIFKLMKRYKAWKVVAVTLFINLCTSYCISRHGSSFLFHNLWVYNPLLVFHLLFSFSLGAMAARTHFFEKLKEKARSIKHHQIYAWGGVIALISINCVFKYNFFYAFMIISCLTVIPIKGVAAKTLTALGDHSMNMWMIHTWFCYYLFHSFIYSFTYPIAIFIVLTVISYLSSIVVNFIARPIELRLMPKAEVKVKPIL